VGRRLKVYTKPSRFNLVLSLEQYKFLLERKRRAKEFDERVTYKDLVEKWGIKQHHMASAVYRGIKQYDEYMKEEERVSNIRRQIAARSMERRNESRTVGVRAVTTEASRSSLEQYSQGGAVRRGYSDYIRTQYFEE
jgi:hypothetical protein